MAQQKAKGVEVKVTLTRENLIKRSLKNLQNISTKLNLSLGNKSMQFDRAQLIDNLIEYANIAKKAELKRRRDAEKGRLTDAEIKAMTIGELIVTVEGMGFAPAPTATKEALQETVKTYKGVAAVMPTPKERKAKEAKDKTPAPTVKLSTLGLEATFRYPTSQTKYKVTEIADTCTIIVNVETGKDWKLKSEKEINREVVVSL